MQFTDRVTLAGTRRRDDGYLVADARIARTGIQTYLGSEVGRPDLELVRVYRPGAEVFSQETLKSATHRPVTNDHPPDMVTSENWKKYAVGQTGDEITGEGIYIRVPLMVSDAETIREIEAGKQELSAGYSCDLDFVAGVTEAGEAYDAIQRNIRLNHVAIVRQGRAGPDVRIGDRAVTWGIAPQHDQQQEKENHMAEARITVTLGDQVIDVTGEHAVAIERFKQVLADEKAGLIRNQNSVLAARDADLARKDAEIDALKASVSSGADFDARVEARAALVITARALVKDISTEGLTDTAIRRAVVAAVAGEAAVEGKSDTYIDARFDVIVEDRDKSAADPFRKLLSTGLRTADGGDLRGQALQARADRDRALRDAWKGEDVNQDQFTH
jgi:hypothetical protein